MMEKALICAQGSKELLNHRSDTFIYWRRNAKYEEFVSFLLILFFVFFSFFIQKHAGLLYMVSFFTL